MIDDTDKEFKKIIGNDDEEEGPGEKELEEIKQNIIINEQEQHPASYEEWTTKLLEKRQNLEHIVKQNLPHLWLSIQLIVSIKCILNIADCTLPVLMILLGAASSNKTVPIEMVMEEPNTYYTDSFSAKAFVSHSTAVKKKDLKEIDMLPKIRFKLFLAPEMSPMFTKKDEDLIEIIGILTRIADGRGFQTDSGAHGHRGYTGNYMFTMVGAAIDIPWRVHKHMGNLGPKLYFFRLPRLNRTNEDYFKQLKGDPFGVKSERVRTALKDYLHWLQLCPKMELDEETKLKKIVWDSDKDEDEAIKIIIRIGKLLAYLRAVVPTRETQGTQGLYYNYEIAKIEEPDRAMEVLRNIARGFALTKGRNYITKEDVSLPIKVVLSTASIEKVSMFDLLLAHKGILKTSIITASLNVEYHAAHRVMAEFKAAGLVDVKEPETETQEKEMILRDEFDWFLTDEFKVLRQGFIPTDNREEMEEYAASLKSSNKQEESCLDAKIPPTTYCYTCYECKKVNHGTPIYQTDSLSDYQRHWITLGHKGPCQPGLADIALHGWERQGKDWET